MTDYRALLADLVKSVEDLTSDYDWQYNWKGEPTGPLADFDDGPLERARAALVEPKPAEPTTEELQDMLYYEFTTSTGFGENVDAIGFARAVLKRWGQ